jgi:hypothetical protein
MIKFIFLATFLFLSVTLIAQIEKIDTDRPDQTESPYTVPEKWMQFEMGFLKQTDKYQPDYKELYFQHPSLLTKYGLSNSFELRLITETASFKDKTTYTKPAETGISSMQLGCKMLFFSERGIRPKTSLIAHYDFASLRTIGNATTNGANFRFTMQHSIYEKFSLSYNIGMEWEQFDKAPAYIYTLASGCNISDKWYVYAELFGFIWKHEKPENNFDIGIAYYINQNLKVDISAGLGINKKAPDSYFAIGISCRFKAAK